MSSSILTFQKVLSALILSCGLASINQQVLVSVISEMAIARRQKINQKNSVQEKPPELDLCPSLNLPCIASNMTEKCEQEIC